MRARWILPCLLLWAGLSAAWGQTAGERELKKVADRYLSAWRTDNYRPKDPLRSDSVRVDEARRELRVYVNEPFCAQPFTPATVAKVYRELPVRFPQPYNAYRLVVMGRGGKELSEYIPNYLREDGQDASRRWGEIRHKGNPWVKRLSRPYEVPHGLEGRHLMINPSHGRYYRNGRWRWQRPYLFCTTEDLLTHSFVFPYLIPMLERAGAVVYTARERDPQPLSVVVDNDTPQDTAAHAYLEIAHEDEAWSPAGTLGSGFAMPALPMPDSVNAFRLGTARCIPTTSRRSRHSSVTWTPRIPAEGRYAVYVSYATLPGSVSDAHYTVYHRGGRSRFRVNQQMGGGTWVYLGTFDFEAGSNRSGRVVLTNESDYRGVVTADAVRFGGGTAINTRGSAGTSGMPRFLEGARYHAQWCGLPDTLYSIGDGTNDYNDDIRSRSSLLNYVAGGSAYLPAPAGLRVPIEACLGLHSDAGARTDGTIYGTLGICTTVKGDTLPTYPSGLSRMASADMIGMLMNGVTEDLGRMWHCTWTRRELWDRSYGESRTPDVPAVILEMFSHQNFRDLVYAHDPLFKQSMARAIYKSLLRYVNSEHGIRNVVVQPLPVHRFCAQLTPDGKQVLLSWSPTADSLEATASPTGYVVYCRTADEDFDEGRLVERDSVLTLPLTPGLRYDFRVSAVNDGGESAPSEVLSVYSAPDAVGRVLIVNGFYRLSGPARIATADSVGFLLRRDPGVPDGYTASFCGEQLDFNPAKAGREGRGALGYCGNELEGKIIGGNTFDYPALHGAAIAASGRYSYASTSREAWLDGVVRAADYNVVDYIAGAECDVPHNLRPFKALDAATCQALQTYLQGGGSLLLTGCYVASDMPSPAEQTFLREVLKYNAGGRALTETFGPSLGSTASPLPADTASSAPRPLALTTSPLPVSGLGLSIPIRYGLTSSCYPLPSFDVLTPADPTAFTAFAYPDGRSAGIAYAGSDYRLLAMGFPFESIAEAPMREVVMQALLKYLVP